MLRLTVHLSGVKKSIVQTKDGSKEILRNTETFKVNDENEGAIAMHFLLNNHTENVKITKHYYSNR